MKRGDRILCLEDTDRTEKGEYYEITEIVNHSQASKEDIKNEAIYVDIGEGWQFKLWKRQYQS